MTHGPSSSGSPPQSGFPARCAVRSLIRVWIGWWVLCVALWMVLDDTTALPELIDSAVAGAVGATAATLTVRHSPVRFAPRASWLRGLVRPLVQYALDLPILVRALRGAIAHGERDPGRLRTVPFRLEQDPAVRLAQVALASVAGSFAANTIVVAIDEDAGELIVHELAAVSSRSGADPLGLG